MAIEDDLIIVNRKIRLSLSYRNQERTNTYSVLDLHRWLQGLADNGTMSLIGPNFIDITSSNPSVRHSDKLISLVGFTISEKAANILRDGAIRMGDDYLLCGTSDKPEKKTITLPELRMIRE